MNLLINNKTSLAFWIFVTVDCSGTIFLGDRLCYIHVYSLIWLICRCSRNWLRFLVCGRESIFCSSNSYCLILFRYYRSLRVISTSSSCLCNVRILICVCSKFSRFWKRNIIWMYRIIIHRYFVFQLTIIIS